MYDCTHSCAHALLSLDDGVTRLLVSGHLVSVSHNGRLIVSLRTPRETIKSAIARNSEPSGGHRIPGKGGDGTREGRGKKIRLCANGIGRSRQGGTRHVFRLAGARMGGCAVGALIFHETFARRAVKVVCQCQTALAIICEPSEWSFVVPCLCLSASVSRHAVIDVW